MTTSSSVSPRTPEWVRDAVFYQIFPDRFASSLTVPKPNGLSEWGSRPTYHGYQGGDLVGVVEHLDYLQDVGVNALYFTPIFQSASNHRYHTHDYERVDPMLGGNAALRRLIDEAHRRGIRIVLDGVFNHASRGFFQFHDILENGKESPYVDWFHINSFPLNAYDPDKAPGYGAWWGLPALPKFNVRSPGARKYLLDVGRRWIDFGIDGWRLDVANEIDDDDFWREFRETVRAGNPEAYIVGEVWNDSSHWLKGDMWDAVMNYMFTRDCIAFFIGGHVDETELKRTCLYPVGESGAEAFARRIDALLAMYRPDVTAVMLNLLDSHDMARFLSLARGDKSALRLATLFQMTYPGAPSVYYGDEIGLDGGHDPLNRAAFPWNESAWDHDLLHEFQKLIALRHRHAALRRGTYQSLIASDDVYAFARALDGETFIIALNSSRETRRVEIPIKELGTFDRLQDLLSRESFDVVDGVVRDLKLAPRSGCVLSAAAPFS